MMGVSRWGICGAAGSAISTAAGKSAGSSRTSLGTASTPPVEAPITMMSCSSGKSVSMISSKEISFAEVMGCFNDGFAFANQFYFDFRPFQFLDFDEAIFAHFELVGSARRHCPDQTVDFVIIFPREHLPQFAGCGLIHRFVFGIGG